MPVLFQREMLECFDAKWMNIPSEGFHEHDA